MDHAAGIAYYLSQRAFVGNAPGRIIVHRSLVQPIHDLMEVWARIEGHPTPSIIQGVTPLEDVLIRRDLFVRPFTVRHTPDSLGFSLIEKRHKLKAEFHGKSGPQLVALKGEGIEIEDRFEVPILSCTGDTAIGKWLELDFVRNSRVVLMECTFFDSEHRERARAGKHIHVDDLAELLAAMPDAQFVLYHITRRTDLRTAKCILERAVSADDLQRITFLMERPPRDHVPQHPRGATDAIRQRSS